MQYVGQTCRFLKARFSEHYRQTKKPRKIDNFLYRHFKQTNHSTSSIYLQPVQKILLSAMPRGVAVANIYVVNQLLNLTLMVDNFL